MGSKRVRIRLKEEGNGREISQKIALYISERGGIAEALKDFKPDSANIVAWGREMSNLGYLNNVKMVSGLDALIEYCHVNALPLGQTLTYLYHRGEMPVVQPRVEILPKGGSLVLEDSPLEDLAAMRKEAVRLLARIDGLMCRLRNAGP